MKSTIKKIVDLAMMVIIVILMAYFITGREFHEYIGTAMLALFIEHTILNYKWYKAMFKGKYSPYRIYNLILILALVVAIVLLGYSGITMSKYAFWFLPAWDGVATARRIHLAASYWFYILTCMHLGNHFSLMANHMKKKSKGIVLFQIIIYAFSIYGIVNFIRQRIFFNMFLLTEFAYFDSTVPTTLFFIQYLSIMVLFETVGYYLSKSLKKFH